MVDITESQDACSKYMPGRWEACEECGHTGQPTEPDRKVPCMGAILGPIIPTPEDILKAAGLTPAW